MLVGAWSAWRVWKLGTTGALGWLFVGPTLISLGWFHLNEAKGFQKPP